MRIAVFTDADFDRTDSRTATLGALVRHAPADLRPRIYTLSDLEIDEPEYLAVRSPAVPLRWGDAGQVYVPRLRELERRLAADDIRALHITSAGSAGLAARYLARRCGLPLYGSLHGLPVDERTANGAERLTGPIAQSLRAGYLRWLYGACSTVFVRSASAADWLTRAGWHAPRLAVWPGGVDPEAFAPGRRSQRLRTEWHVSDRRPAILCVGHLGGESGTRLIETLGSLLHRLGAAHRFVIVGEGPARAALEDACPDAVFAGRLTHRDLATVMASADLFLAPGEGWSGGLALLEAQASGLPVVAIDGRTAREHVRAGTTAAICGAHDVPGLGACVAELLRDAGCRRAFGEAGRRFAHSRAWPSSLERVYALYRSGDRPLAAGLREQAIPAQGSAPSVEPVPASWRR